MIYHLTAFITGYVLDLLLGDPFGSFHPVVWIGRLISGLTNRLIKKKRGLLLVVIVITVSVAITALILCVAYIIHPIVGTLVESFITYQCLATKSLYKESMKVYYSLRDDGLEAGRKSVAMIVGRDTESLSEEGVIKAAVETVAENTSDGVIAPLIYLAIGGPILGICYKAINTMDSMVGYKNDKYLEFGKWAAKLDDVVNYLPARISALLMIVSAALLGRDYSARHAFKIFKRDRYNHASPNSAQTESVCAGALSVQLAGPTSYFGKMVEKPFIGDSIRTIELFDIKRANRLMILTSVLCEVICITVLAIFVI